ncbi:putative chemotaxis CheB/CheR fusion protein [Magnetofaba australis IT-1]|uniref:protein-glutamate O-methyltransferase n=1 Tax=Magnetofaba australis IT-1 TaxID=1434232 RepID=A0A1Y2K5G0_9PROT|nr:putative chemotaxis CheB/CheR fusion protein [Magnetofaba australis IT-1]
MVGIGASAGGLEAIQSFFQKMPATSGAAFVVVQHLSPDYKSLMVELLSKQTQMPVKRITDGIPVEADTVYLIPPKKNVKIFHGRLVLTDQDHNALGINLPIDIFFTSLAEDQGDKGVAVILSGAGSDGTRGIKSIKEKGGMVMAQAEASAKFDSMPKSAISTHLPDFVLPPEEMPEQLMAFLKHPYATREGIARKLAEKGTGLTRIYSLLRDNSGIDFTFYKTSTVMRRIERRMTINRYEDLDEYVRFLESSPREQTVLFRELLIGVTSFFRDAEAFQLLREKYIPELIRNNSGKQLRVWVASCSTGEEAYSLAILFMEAIQNNDVAVDVKIFATDVDQDAIFHASQGAYPKSIVADVPPALLNKYFLHKGDNYHISRQIREMVVFAQHNLIKDPPFTNINFVSCRNLLIYFQPVLQQRVLEGFNFSLTTDGLLFLGTSETPGEMESYFTSLHPKWKIYRCKGKRRVVGESHVVGKYEHKSWGGVGGLGRPDTTSPAKMLEEERVLARFVETVSGAYLPFALVVNEQMQLLQVLGESRDYMRIPFGSPITDISKLMVEDLYIPVSTGVAKVFRSGEEVSFSNIRMQDPDAHSPRYVNVRIMPLKGRKNQPPLAALFIQEQSNEGAGVKSGESYDFNQETLQRINDLEHELQLTRENLQATIEELETSNEELQATNEELLASNEELQSTNEELQSVNEELYTVNAELQNKILELTEVNNDLDNLMNSTQVISLFLDDNLDVRRFTTSAAQLFNILDSDIGRPLAHLSHNLRDVDLIPLIGRVNRTHKSEERVVRSVGGDFYQLRVLPYRIAPDAYQGVVVVFVNINTLQHAQQELNRVSLTEGLIRHTAQIGSWEWDIASGRMIWSENVAEMFGLQSSADLEGDFDAFLKILHSDDRVFVSEMADKAVTEHGVFDIDHRIMTPDEAVRWMALTGKVIYDEHGRPQRMVGIIRDISASKELEEQVQEKNALLASIYRTAPIGIGMVSERNLLWVNPQVCRISGYEQSELVGQDARMLYPSDEEYEFVGKEKYRQVLVNGTGTVKSRWLRKDGDVVDILMSSSPVDKRNLDKGVTFMVLDLTNLSEFPELAMQDRFNE